MANTVEIPVTDLRIGMVITAKTGSQKIESITPCPQTVPRGIPKIHVNGRDCYDTIGRVKILANPNLPG